MTDQRDLPHLPQPEGIVDITQAGRVERPRRTFVREAYPDSPIVIPPDRREKARELLVTTYELWERGQHLNALTGWFGNPAEVRADAVDAVLLDESQAESQRSLRSAQYDTEGKPEHLVLKHYALLATEAIGKIIRPDESEPLTEKDVHALGGNPGENDQLRKNLRRLGLNSLMPLFHDMDDFMEPQADIQRNFSFEETRQLLVKLVPHLESIPDWMRANLLGAFGLVQTIKYADLLIDPRLTDVLAEPFLTEMASWGSYMENYITQGVFPSPEFFEEAFRRINPKDSDLHANFHISVKAMNDTEVPASAFYFTMLRKIIHLGEERERHPEYGQGSEERITAYLLNDAFMEHVLPYLNTDVAYEDNLIHATGRSMFYNGKQIATGEEAKALKRKRLGEVIQTAIDYAIQKGDMPTAQKLRERGIGGIRFADLINS